MDAETATASAKACRSIIDPISNFPDLLSRLAAAEKSKKSRTNVLPSPEKDKSETKNGTSGYRRGSSERLDPGMCEVMTTSKKLGISHGSTKKKISRRHTFDLGHKGGDSLFKTSKLIYSK